MFEVCMTIFGYLALKGYEKQELWRLMQIFRFVIAIQQSINL